MPRLTAVSIIKQAMKETGSTNSGIICLQIEDIMWEELSKTTNYVSNSLVFYKAITIRAYQLFKCKENS